MSVDDALRALDPPDPPITAPDRPVVIRPWEEPTVVRFFQRYDGVAYGERGVVRLFRRPGHPEAATMRTIRDPKTILVEVWRAIDEGTFTLLKEPQGTRIFNAIGERDIELRVVQLTRQHGRPVYWLPQPALGPGRVVFYSGKQRRPLQMVALADDTPTS